MLSTRTHAVITHKTHTSLPSMSMSICVRRRKLPVPRQLQHGRTFISARVKWVRDPYLDIAVSKEKDLKQAISLKNQILSYPSKSAPLSSLSLLKPHLGLPTTALKFIHKYPFVFQQFQPGPALPLHVKLTPRAVSVHKEEMAIYSSQAHRDDAIKRLAKVLMLTGMKRLPLHVIDRFKFDLGLPPDFITTLLSDYPDYFHVCEDKDWLTDKDTFFLELVSWRENLAVSEMEKRVSDGDLRGVKRGQRIRFSLSFPYGFDLRKRVKDWVDQWQDLVYISPYENVFHLNPNGDQAEKWTVAVLHELLWLLVSKKTERDNIFCLGNYLGFGDRFEKALKHHPGIFYVSNKIRTQTVVLREAYRKDLLVEKHPLMGMRFRYIHLLNADKKNRRKLGAGVTRPWSGRHFALSANKGVKGKVNDIKGEEEEKSGASSSSEFGDMRSADSEFEDVDNDEVMKMER